MAKFIAAKYGSFIFNIEQIKLFFHKKCWKMGWAFKMTTYSSRLLLVLLHMRDVINTRMLDETASEEKCCYYYLRTYGRCKSSSYFSCSGKGHKILWRTLALVSRSQTLYRMLHWEIVWHHKILQLVSSAKKLQSNQIA